MRTRSSWIVLIFILILPQAIRSQDRDAMLTDEDIALEFYGKKDTPALSAPPHAPEYWESYNQWMCFDREYVELFKVGITEGDFGDSEIPMLSISMPGLFLEISIFGETQRENDEIFNRWEQLLADTRRICAYAAYLNAIDLESHTPGSAWIINKLKTDNGYWTFKEHQVYTQILEVLDD